MHDTHATESTMVQLERQGRIANVRFDRGFAANGLSIALMRELTDVAHRLRDDAQLCRAWEEIEALTVAAIEGWCVGGGVALAAAMPPNGVHMCKTAINAHANALAGATSHADRDQFALLQASADGAEAVNAFLDKRDPVFTGG
jgi:enoyl-CoA hydratase/carnithine racemase